MKLWIDKTIQRRRYYDIATEYLRHRLPGISASSITRDIFCLLLSQCRPSFLVYNMSPIMTYHLMSNTKGATRRAGNMLPFRMVRVHAVLVAILQCLSFFDLRLPITPLISSKFPMYNITEKVCFVWELQTFTIYTVHARI